MLTTSLNPDDVAQMQNLPIAGYLIKPITAEKLSQILRQHFGYSVPAN